MEAELTVRERLWLVAVGLLEKGMSGTRLLSFLLIRVASDATASLLGKATTSPGKAG